MNDRFIVSVIVGLVVIAVGWPLAAIALWLNQAVPLVWIAPFGLVAAVVTFLVDWLVKR